MAEALQITVTDTPTLIAAAGGTYDLPQSVRMSVPAGGNTVYVGTTPEVDDTDGFPVDAAETFEFNEVNTPLYGVTASGSQAVRVFRRY